MQAEIWTVILASLVDLGPEALDLTQKEKAALQESVPETMVDYEGTLISATAAQRRRYVSCSQLWLVHNSKSMIQSVPGLVLLLTAAALRHFYF